jgi:hypothetical protein
MSLSQSCITHYAYDIEGKPSLGSVECKVSPGTSNLLIKQPFDVEDQCLVRPLIRELKALHVALPSKTIVVEIDGPKASGLERFPDLAMLMSILGAIGAIPNEQVESSIFDASVRDGQLSQSDNDPLAVALLAAECSLDYWGCTTSVDQFGLVGNGRSYAAYKFGDVIDHFSGGRLVQPAQSMASDIHRIAGLTDLQMKTTQFGTAPVFEVGGVACTLRNGQIFTLQLDLYQDL